MGNQGSHNRHHGEREDPATPGSKPQPGAKTSASKPAASAQPTQAYDLVVTATPGDKELVDFLKTQLDSASIPAYCNSDQSVDAAKFVGKVLVDAKLLVFVVGKESHRSDVCQDHVSLAYISNKPIAIVSHGTKEEMLKDFSVGMKLTLEGLSWMVFDKDEDRDTAGRQFVQLIQDLLTKPVGDTAEASIQPTLESAPPGSRVVSRKRIYTKMRAPSTLHIGAEVEPATDSFWDRNFRGEEDVLWFRFQQAFLSDYEAQLSGLFNDDNIPWLLNMLHNDIFDGVEKVTREQFFQVRGESRNKNAFWRSVSQIAVEKFNMQEVFNMKSSVRLTAIEKLAQFGSPAVIDALVRLLADHDPNVRAVAAISLGRTGVTDEQVADKLIKLLKDSDRIVRQSACLSLGHMKCIKAIPHIGDVWRNDFISVVRSAARTALENMDVPEAKSVLKVTKVLEDEIEALAGDHAVV